MEGQGYSKSGFVAESLSPLAILASQVRHDHTYAKAKPKDAVDSSTVSIDSPAGEWDIAVRLPIVWLGILFLFFD